MSWFSSLSELRARVMRRLRWAILPLGCLVAGVIAWGSSHPWESPATEPGQLDGGACPVDLGPSPFMQPNASHILLADFYGLDTAGSEFADSVSRKIDIELRRFEEEELPRMAVHVPRGSVEFKRLRCFVGSHAEADRVAAALGAELVIWGTAYCSVARSVQVAIWQSITTGDVSGDHNQIGSIDATPKPYSVCPSATLHRPDTKLLKSTTPIDLGNLAHLDLPTLSSHAPFQLVNFTLGLHFLEHHQPWIAARFFEKSVEYILSPQDENLGTIYGYLARAFLELPGGTEKALYYSRRALDRVRGDTAQAATLQSYIGGALLAQGRYAESRPYFDRALAIDGKLVGPDHPTIARDLSNLAQVLHETHRLREAEPLMRRALAIDEKSLGPEHPYVATRCNNLALLLHAMRRSSEAEPLLRRALAIDEKSLGPDHPSVATRLNSLAHLLYFTDRSSEAEPLLRRALAIDEKSLGLEHPNVANRLGNLAHLLQATGRMDEAERLMRRALLIDEKSLGPDHPDLAGDLLNLANVLQSTQRVSEAEPLLRRALAIVERSLGPEHPRVGAALNNLGQLLQEMNRPSEAEPLLRRSLAVTEKSVGPDDRNVARVLTNLAQLLQETDRSNEAEPLLRRALAIDEKSLGFDHPTTVSIRRQLRGATSGGPSHAASPEHLPGAPSRGGAPKGATTWGN